MRFIFLLLLVSSCASTTHYGIKVDSVSRHPSSTGRFIILSGMKDVKTDDLRFQEYSKIVANGLKKKGFSPVSEKEKPDFVVFLLYAISEPQTSSHVSSSPIYGTRTNYVNNAYGQPLGSVNSFGVQGYKVQSYDVTTYTRLAVIQAYNLDNQMIWETKITITGSSSDLKGVFPYMIYGAIPYLGNTTEEQVVVDIEDGDIKVKGLRAPANESSEARAAREAYENCNALDRALQARPECKKP